jgi:hypothetical protein
MDAELSSILDHLVGGRLDRPENRGLPHGGDHPFVLTCQREDVRANHREGPAAPKDAGAGLEPVAARQGQQVDLEFDGEWVVSLIGLCTIPKR